MKAFCFDRLIPVWRRPKSYVYIKLHSLLRGRPRPKTRGLVIIKYHSEKGKHRSLNVKQEDLWNLFIYLGFCVAFNTVQSHITMGSWKGRGNQYIQFVRVLYCKLPTNGKQLPAFPLQAVTGIEPRPQRWEARVLPLYHRGPLWNKNTVC